MTGKPLNQSYSSRYIEYIEQLGIRKLTIYD